MKFVMLSIDLLAIFVKERKEKKKTSSLVI